MKLNSASVSKALSLLLLITVSTILGACADQSGTKTSAVPIAPGTVEPSTESTSGVGSFQGPIVNASGNAQAILTLDVWVKDGQTNAQLTVSPSGATALIDLKAGNQSFNLQLPAKAYGPTVLVSVTGAWNGSAWTGQLSNETGATNSFSLGSGASTQSAVSVGAPTGSFDGQLTFKPSGGTRGVSLIIVPSNDVGDAMAATLSSRVSLTAYLKYSNGQKEDLKNVIWDRDASTFSGDGTASTSFGTTMIRCQLSEMNAGSKDVLQCALTTSKSNSTVASGPLSQKRAVVAPPYPTPPVQPNPVPQPVPPPAPTPYQPPAPPAPGPTPFVVIKNSRAFEGTGVFTGEDGQKQTRLLTLTVTLASAPTGQIQKAKVKFIIGGSRVGANFIDSTFNSGSGELIAKELLVLGALAGQLELTCGGVQFDSPQYDFMCHYESSVTNVTGAFHLKAPQL